MKFDNSSFSNDSIDFSIPSEDSVNIPHSSESVNNPPTSVNYQITPQCLINDRNLASYVESYDPSLVVSVAVLHVNIFFT